MLLQCCVLNNLGNGYTSAIHNIYQAITIVPKNPFKLIIYSKHDAIKALGYNTLFALRMGDPMGKEVCICECL